MKILNLGTTANNKTVLLDYGQTNIEYHLLETPDLIELVQEALPHLVLDDRDQVVLEQDMGRVVGTTNLVETTDRDTIVYAKRIGREQYTRFAKNRELTPCRSIVIVIRRSEGIYYLWTAMCGKKLPPEAYQENSAFNQTHALVYDESLIQLDTLVESRPVNGDNIIH